ncbi:MAG: rod shape-determining protein MreC [Kiritimatiellia bacterium]
MTGRTGLIAACGAVVALGLWLVCGRSVVKEAVYPVENGRVAFARTAGTWLKGFLGRGGVAVENSRLKIENDALRMLRTDVLQLADENARLRAMLGLDAPHNPFPTNRWLCAPVLSQNGVGGVRSLIRVGRGSADGVTTNAAVAVPDGLVGRVEQVSRRTADIRLITDPSVKVSCDVETEDAAFGAVRGILEGGGARPVRAESGASILYVIEPLRVRHLRRRPRLPARARVITNGLGRVYPRGLTVGFLIDGQDEDETVLEREGDVVPAVDFPALENVFIRRED